MKIYPIECGNFKLDGGAMFGVVPKSIWQKTNPADANNMVNIATRSWLIEDGEKLILIDAGMGDKQSEKFFGYYHLWGDFSLDKSLKNAGFHRDEVTDVFFTHLHFDHCGGAIQRKNGKEGFESAFKNAKFWSNKDHWGWAVEPNAREKASFLKENILPIQETGQLNFIPTNQSAYLKSTQLGFEVITVDGHTEKQMLPVVNYNGRTIVFASDLIPTAGHIPLVYVMGYDTRPLLTLEEKKIFLNKAVQNDWILAFEHDAHHELCTLKKTERGVRINEFLTYEDIFA